VLTSNKGLLKGKCFDSIAMEYIFLIKTLWNDKFCRTFKRSCIIKH
jgi:hypothetical protein